MKINVLSLFDGISVARYALERAGIKVGKYYASEICKYALQVADKNYPDNIQLGDVENINPFFVKDEIHLLIGGSPCQDLSIAKMNRKGLDGSRSGLFWKYVEMLNSLMARSRWNDPWTRTTARPKSSNSVFSKSTSRKASCASTVKK